MKPDFDAFVGIDWSGARGRSYRGIAVAICEPGASSPRLIPAPARVWTRSAVLDWLADAPSEARWLVGIDLAFALPPPFPAPPRIWADVDAHCRDDADLLGSRFADADVRFWRAGRQPPDWSPRRRPAELACVRTGLGHPETPLKLIGARQVGRGTLAGARLLHRLHTQHADRWTVWPFEADAEGFPDRARHVVLEIYPRLFIRRAGFGNAKLRTAPALSTALQHFGCEPAADDSAVDEHQADALISAAGLRRLAADESLWRAGAGEAHGWIFGVPRC